VKYTLGALAVVSLSAFIVLERHHIFGLPLESDTASFAVVAHEWSQGRALYSDLWDEKPPAIFVTYALFEKYFGAGDAAIFWMGVAAAIGTLVAIFFAAFWMTSSLVAGICAALFWALINADPFLEAALPMTEAFINLCFVAALAGLIRFLSSSKHSVQEVLIAGVFLAAVSFYRLNLLMSVAILVGGFIVALRLQQPGGAPRTWLRPAMALLVPSIVLWLGVIPYFCLTHRGPIFFKTFFSYSWYYAHTENGGLLSNLVRSVQWNRWASLANQNVLSVLGPLGIVGMPTLALALVKKNATAAMLFGYFVAAWIGMALPGRFYAHYYQLLMPPLVLAAVVGPWLLVRTGRPRGRWIFTAYALLALLLMLRELPLLRFPVDDWSRLTYGEFYLDVRKAGDVLRRQLRPGETFYEIGYESGLYFYARRSPPTGILWADHWDAGPLQDEFSARIIRDLSAHPPDMILLNRQWAANPRHRGLAVVQWWLPMYRPAAIGLPDEFIGFVRRGSDLEARLPSGVKAKPPAPAAGRP